MKTKSRRVTIPFIMLGLSAVSIASLPQANADDSEQCVDQRRVCLKPCIKTKEDKEFLFLQRENDVANAQSGAETKPQSAYARCNAERDRSLKNIKTNYETAKFECRRVSPNPNRCIFGAETFKFFADANAQTQHANCRARADLDYQSALDAQRNQSKYDEIRNETPQSVQDDYDQCRQDCDEQYKICLKNNTGSGDNGGDGSPDMRDPSKPCTPGTRPNALGICVKLFQSFGIPSQTQDGCPPGEERGHDDRCKPKISVLGAVPTRDGWTVICPAGTKPSPIDGGCVIDVDPTTAGGGDDSTGPMPKCPDGSEPGADDGCFPIIKDLLKGKKKALWAVDALKALGSSRLDPIVGRELNAMPANDVESVIENSLIMTESEPLDEQATEEIMSTWR